MQTDKFCQFKHRHSLFDCPSISKVKQMKRWSWQHLSQTSTVPMKIWLLSFLSGHTHAIVFRLPRVDAGHQPCDCVRGAQPRICLTNICSFMVIFSRLCKHVSLWQMLLPVLALLITLWRFANFQTLFCLPVLNKKKKKIPISAFMRLQQVVEAGGLEGREEVGAGSSLQPVWGTNLL